MKPTKIVIACIACASAFAFGCSSSSSSNDVTCGPGTTLSGSTCVSTDDGSTGSDGGSVTCGSGTVLNDAGQCVPSSTNDGDVPNFAGIATIHSDTTTAVTLTWAAASDAKTTPDKIYYHVYVAQTSAAETYGSPQFTSLPGKTSYQVTGLEPGTAYFFVVRAVNGEGNEDKNTVEKSVSTSNDSTPPQFAGVLYVDLIAPTGTATQGQATLTWAQATDDQSGQSEIAYDIYDSTTSGGENFAGTPKASVTGTTTATINGIDVLKDSRGNYIAADSHYYVVLARDKAGNTNPNRVERKLSAVPNLTDHIMPILAGIPGVANSAKCARSGCHLGPTAPGGLQLDTPTNAYNGLVNVAASSRYVPWTIAELTAEAGTPTTLTLPDGGTAAMGNVSFGPLTKAQYQTFSPYNETTAFRVIPSLPLVSFMYQKITNTHKRLNPNDPGNAEMPNPASTGQQLTAEERDRVMRWIAGGALLTAP